MQRREQEAARFVEGSERVRGSFGWLRGVNANLKIPPFSPPSWFPGANDTSSFINGDRVAAFDLIYACIQKPRAQKPIDRAANETDESESEREREGGRGRKKESV